MSVSMKQYFDYDNEPRHHYLCIDMKSFYASCECVERGLHPLKTLLVVMSGGDSPGGLALATSPRAKKELGISNVSRRFEIPNHPDLYFVPPRMNLYIEKNTHINNIFRQYVADEDIHVYSIDETFIRVDASEKLFNMTPHEFAVQFQREIYHELGLFCTIGIGDNMLLSKLALDNEAKNNRNMIAEWHYEDVPNTVWKIKELTDFWGINKRTKKRLNDKGIYTVYDLAHYDYFSLKSSLGVMGEQLVAHAWGIDRSNIREKYQPKSNSIGNSQVLTKDYTNPNETKIVLREIAEQVAIRLRKKELQTGCIGISVGYSRNEVEKGFSKQLSVTPTNSSKMIADYCLALFEQNYKPFAVRNLAVSCSKLEPAQALQLNLFDTPEKTINTSSLDKSIDMIRNRFGFDSIVHASSLLEGATAIDRSHLVGGHAGGMDGIT